VDAADPLPVGSRTLLAGAFALSLALHALTFLVPDRWLAVRAKARPDPAILTARLEPREPEQAPEVLKNTLDPAPEKAPPPRKPPPRTEASLRKDSAEKRREVARAERLPEPQQREALGRLSQTLLYPPEAVAQGIQGEVVLLLDVGDGGRVVGASVAASSGHAMLDDAALRAARLMGSLSPALAGRTILLPVRFRLL